MYWGCGYITFNRKDFFKMAVEIPEDKYEGLPTHMNMIVDLAKKVKELEERIVKLEEVRK